MAANQNNRNNQQNNLNMNMRGLSQDARDYLSSLQQSIDIQKGMREGFTGIQDALKAINNVSRNITSLERERARVQRDLLTATGRQHAMLLQVNAALDTEIDNLQRTRRLYEDNLREVNKKKIAVKELGKAMANLPNSLQKAYSKIKGLGVFDMDKAIKTSALSMGLLKKGSDSFYGSINAASKSAISMGVTVEELAKMQGDFSDELGRAVMLGEKGLVAITKMAKGTGMGAEAAAKMASEMSMQSFSAEKTAEYVEQTMNDSTKMGLNSGKVIKNIGNSIKLLNRYNFKGGANGLKEMAKTVTKLGIDMESVAPMAEKLFNIDGAVEMSAQLQVLGGKWSSLADPFKLMYMARNDMEGLTRAMAEAASESATFDKDGKIQIGALEMSRLREVAEKTGVSMDDLVKSAKNIGNFKQIRKQVSLVGLTDDEIQFLENTAQLEGGKAIIEVNGDQKLLSTMGSGLKQFVKEQMAIAEVEKATLEKRAKDAMTFDDSLKSVFDSFKSSLVPFAKTLAEKAAPAFKRLNDWLIKEDIFGKIERFGVYLADKIGGFLDFATKNPVLSIGAVVGAKILGFVAEQGMWIANGLALSLGFNTGVGGRGGLVGMLRGMFGGSGAATAGGVGGNAAGGAAGAGIGATVTRFAKASGVLAGVVAAGQELSKNWDDENMGTGEKAGRAGVKGGIAGGSAWGGALLGAKAGAILGAFGGPLGIAIGTAVGALAGGIGGAYFGGKAGDMANSAMFDDAVVQFNPKDKFMKVNDSTMIAGTHENGNKDLAKSIMSSSYTQSKPTNQQSQQIGVSLNDLNISGTIELKLNGDRSIEFGKTLLNDPVFIRNISKMVNMATASAVSGTQPQKNN
jgi:hypothetical protein